MDTFDELYDSTKAEILTDESVYLVCRIDECSSNGEVLFTPYKLGIKLIMGLCELPYNPNDER